MINNKMGGDLEKIRKVGKYLLEVWKAAGVDLSKVEVVWASDLAADPDYWKLVYKGGEECDDKKDIEGSPDNGEGCWGA